MESFEQNMNESSKTACLLASLPSLPAYQVISQTDPDMVHCSPKIACFQTSVLPCLRHTV